MLENTEVESPVGLAQPDAAVHGVPTRIAAERKARVDNVCKGVAAWLAENHTESRAESRENPALTLEIGCGHGHFLAAYSAAFPQKHCIGIDLLTKRIERACRKRDRAHLRNLAFFKAEANEFLDALPATLQFDEYFFLFPDPWPKNRHHKNRLIQTEMLNRLASLAKPAAHLWFRTDHSSYFEWTQALVSQHPRWRILPDAKWPFEHETFFSKLLPDYQTLVAEKQPENHD
ncbi:MAG: tRNA (guanosine(46)-N7)-methyltransferase TrmB [Puniceicoccales bacterium]|nr:tRNA (guanosine(46)-N7)-methyltransferase TrmB [Puniceicoccales bacterium]